MDLESFYNLVMLIFAAICIHYSVRMKDGTAYLLVSILAIIPMTLLAARDIELTIVMLTMVVVWEIRSLRKDMIKQ